MEKLIRSCIFLVCISGICCHGFAQSDVSLLKEFDSIGNTKNSQDSIGKVLLNQNNFKIQSESFKRTKEYEEFVIKHRKRVFTWQYTSSIIIFCLVMLIVLSGLVLSILHFRKSLKTSNDSPVELELGKTGFKVKSSIIGIIVLLISITFLYLYLSFVYEIKVLS